jgi:hypothetical protein
LPDQFAGQHQDFPVFFFVGLGLVSSSSVSLDPFAKSCRPAFPAKRQMITEMYRGIIRRKPSAASGATIAAPGDLVQPSQQSPKSKLYFE